MNIAFSFFRFCHFGLSSFEKYPEAIPRIKYSSLTPREFFDQFIAVRRPCILTLDNQAQEPILQSLVKNWSSNQYLKERAGENLIDVEIRDKNMGEEFGMLKKCIQF